MLQQGGRFSPARWRKNTVQMAGYERDLQESPSKKNIAPMVTFQSHVGPLPPGLLSYFSISRSACVHVTVNLRK